jgi:hypothetical protein
VVPVLRPGVYIPNHLGDFYHAFADGYDNGPFRDAGLKRFLDSAAIELVSPVQYMDRWEVDGFGTRAIPNPEGRGPFGLPEIPIVKDGGVDAAKEAGAETASETSGETPGDADTTDVPADMGTGDGPEAGADGGAGDADGPTDGTPLLDSVGDRNEAGDVRRDGPG